MDEIIVFWRESFLPMVIQEGRPIKALRDDLMVECLYMFWGGCAQSTCRTKDGSDRSAVINLSEPGNRNECSP